MVAFKDRLILLTLGWWSFKVIRSPTPAGIVTESTLTILRVSAVDMRAWPRVNCLEVGPVALGIAITVE